MRAILGVVVVGLLVGGCAGATSAAKSSGPGVVLVFTTWAPDTKVTNGPEPGYKPVLTGLTSHDIQTAVATLDASGTSWVIDIRFTLGGAKHFADLTSANVAACPGDPAVNPSATCAGRHLAMWLDLTQADIDDWENRTFVTNVSAFFDLKCLQHAAVSTSCPKFISDPITLEAITGGEAQIAGNFTQQSANDLATAIS
ncbi:MAG TPA: hypothetical protein VI384_00815 [Candidatus Dormibacteraeota bacterium]